MITLNKKTEINSNLVVLIIPSMGIIAMRTYGKFQQNNKIIVS